MRILYWLLILLFIPRDTYSQVVKSVVLDSVVVQAVKSGFDVSDFIEMVRADTSFIKGFRQLRRLPHTVDGHFDVYNKRGKILSSRTRNGRQKVEGGKRWMIVDEDRMTGKFYDRKGNPVLYTAELFDDLFFNTDTLAINERSSVSSDPGNSGHIGKLKLLVFSPGSDISGVPFIGDRMAIFKDDMSAYYQYHLSVDSFSDSIPCYVFSVKVVPGYEADVIIQTMNTWFNRKTFDIVYRDYRLKYSTPVFDFDVNMNITMRYKDAILYPGTIQYSGYWDLPLKKAERSRFELIFELE